MNYLKAQIRQFYIASVMCCLFFTSCEKLKNGTVLEKWYSPPSEDLVMIPMTVGTGSSKITFMQQYWVYNGENYCIKVKGQGNKGHIITKTLYLNKAQWDTISIGKFICIDGMCDEDKNNTQKKADSK